jgi:hypothetical protein
VIDPDENGPDENGTDELLRRSLSAPAPSLPSDFNQRLIYKLRRGSKTFDRYRRILLIGYGLTSMAACAVVMRGQGLDWDAISIAILGSLAVVAGIRVAAHKAKRSAEA